MQLDIFIKIVREKIYESFNNFYDQTNQLDAALENGKYNIENANDEIESLKDKNKELKKTLETEKKKMEHQINLVEKKEVQIKNLKVII